MKKLLSLPPNLVENFHDIAHVSTTEWFCTSDPINKKLGSGGGTIWLLESCQSAEEQEQSDFTQWLAKEKRILIHAGGQSRRLPAYATTGKVLTPIPAFRWERGQRIDQTLLTLQMPLYEKMLEKAPDKLRTMIVSGDVYIRTTESLPEIPDADVICYGLWVDQTLATNHGVFMMNRNTPEVLDYMLQKPSTELLSHSMQTHYSLMDIGIWILSDKAVSLLRARSKENGTCCFYDLYSHFGCALGTHPSKPDAGLQDLRVAILPLSGGEFYHFGTSRELISSTTAIQNLIKDQRFIIQKEVKPHPSIFTQNASVTYQFTEQNQNIWVENSYLSSRWTFTRENIVTGIPECNWTMNLLPGQCVDVVPIGDKHYALRPYGYHDTFSGTVENQATRFLNQPVTQWLQQHHIQPEWLADTTDLQSSKLFPVSTDLDLLGKLLTWMLSDYPSEDLSTAWNVCQRLSASDLSDKANLKRSEAQRIELRKQILPLIAANHNKSIFYQLNLQQIAEEYSAFHLEVPPTLPETTPSITRMRDFMWRAEMLKIQGKDYQKQEERAYRLLQQELIRNTPRPKHTPHLSVYEDQIVWGRSAVRIDLAGGWTDTPPYSISTGGNVVNLAIELNGQPPLQVYVKPCKEPVIICRSIDLGAIERIKTYEELTRYNQVGSPFSIPKAALSLIGFAPSFSQQPYASLREQLMNFGSGIEITLLSAIPAGSGLGTSSILAATVLGALSDFCGMGFDKNEIGYRTLALEQLLTTGGGWQDQYGGELPGIKLLQTNPGFCQTPIVRWLPDTLFSQEEYKACHLLYYTGVTRTAKNILTEIVRNMFLNETKHIALLNEIKEHALDMQDTIQKGNFEHYGKLVRTSWQQNKQLDPGTNPPIIESLCQQIDDLCLGYKLPGAGGGGYMYMVAKDPQAALRIRNLLQTHPLTSSSRFIDMKLSNHGLQISRS